MVNNHIFIPPQIPSVGKPAPTARKVDQSKPTQAFDQVLQQQVQKAQELKFSQHALQRLQVRNIQLNKQDLQQLQEGVAKAAQKGARDSLVLLNAKGLAFVVSVKNNTVITAVDGANMKENVFTNIDSAVIM